MQIHNDIDKLIEELKKTGTLEDLTLDQLIYAVSRIVISHYKSAAGTGRFVDLVTSVHNNLRVRLDLLDDFKALKDR